MGTVREYSMMFLVVEIKAREVTCPEERLLIYQQRDTGIGPGRRKTREEIYGGERRCGISDTGGS